MTTLLRRLFLAMSVAILLSGSAAYADSPAEPSPVSGYCVYVTIDNPPFWTRVCTP